MQKKIKINKWINKNKIRVNNYERSSRALTWGGGDPQGAGLREGGRRPPTGQQLVLIQITYMIHYYFWA